MRGPIIGGGMIGGHLGSRVSALLDGQLGPEETEKAWAHVHTCHVCRDQVEREGWVKRQLSGLSVRDTAAAPAGLKGALLNPGLPLGEAYLALDQRPRRAGTGLAVLGGGAVGAAMMGVLALGAAPASAPTIERSPATSVTPAVVPSSPTASASTPGSPAPASVSYATRPRP